MEPILWVLIGAALGGAVAAVVFLLRQRAGGEEIIHVRSRAAMLEEQVRQRETEAGRHRAAAEEAHHAREQAEKQAALAEERLRNREQQLEEQRRLLIEAEKKLAEAFEAAGARALRSNNEQFLTLAKETFEKILTDAKGDVEKKQQAIDALLKPIRESLEKHHVAVAELEKKREAAYARVDEQIKVIAQSHETLRQETGRLVSALRRPEQRGRWGEIQLRNVVELAGMSAHCDFSEQVSVGGVGGDEGRLRPDMVVKLPGEGVIPVDSKVALDAYLNALQPDADKAAEMKRHVRQVQEHVNRLAEKRYWDQFDRTPGVVVLFMPLESALHAALEVNPDLHAQAMSRHVLIATPTLLVALLRAVAYGWQQEAVARNAREIAEAGKELYDRLAKFAEHFTKVGTSLARANASYNDAVGSLERNLLPAARKIKALRATDREDLEPPPQIDVEPRTITAAELSPGSQESSRD
ncbi:MAG: DNA recombination protein RmuC [Phycisphaeraceae bacterium]|nr:MAG: DNA recombination protein RmuC [Phycisphaeraceae bacterium]